MNVDTGEIRKMTTEEVAELNGIAGRELWKPISEDMCLPFGASRKERRALERKLKKLNKQ